LRYIWAGGQALLFGAGLGAAAFVLIMLLLIDGVLKTSPGLQLTLSILLVATPALAISGMALSLLARPRRR
jgi:hypothetical protein